MDALERLNSFLQATEYQGNPPVRGLHLRTARHFADMAEEITKLLWTGMSHYEGISMIDVHATPFLAHAINQVLLQRIDDCIACANPAYCDPWARTGGGAPTLAHRPPVCAEHYIRLRKEAGAALDALFQELESTVREFFTTHTPPYNRVHLPTAAAIHDVIEDHVKPYLLRNLATSRCDSCEKERSLNK
jgi:hypothetical protein